MHYLRFYLFSIFIFTSLAFSTNIHADVVPPVIVKANTSSHYTTSGPQQIILSNDIAETGSINLAQVLQNEAGLQLHDLSGNGSQMLVSIRGFGANASSNSLILINDIPFTNPDIAPPDIATIAIKDIESIEIISGSESVLYGNQAVGGVVNIRTYQQAKPDDIKLIGGIGSYQQKYIAWLLDKNWSDIFLHSNLWSLTTDNYREHNVYAIQELTGYIHFNHLIKSLILNYQIDKESMQFPGALTSTQVKENRRQATNHKDFFNDWQHKINMSYQKKLNEDWRIMTHFERRGLQGNGVLFSPFQQMRTDHFFNLQLTGKLKNILTTSGIELEHDDYRLKSAFGLTDNAVNQSSLFSLLNYSLIKNLTASAGVRGALQQNHLQTTESFTSINRAFIETIGFTYQYQPNLNFYLRRAGSYRFPKSDELAWTPTGMGELKTQRGISYETGFRFFHLADVLQLNLYQLNLQDEIAFNPLQTPKQPFGSNQNLSPTTRIGFSLSGKKMLTSQITIDGQYHFVNARFQNGIFAGNRIPLVAENLAHAGLNLQMSDHFNIYFESVFTGNEFPANDNANISHQNGSFSVFNCSVNYRYKQLTGSFRIDNIFNKLFYLYTVYQPDIQTVFFYPAPERHFTLTLTYDFM